MLVEDETGEKERVAEEWMECKSDEDNVSDYEYKYEEDPENMMDKKYKKPKKDGSGVGVGG